MIYNFMLLYHLNLLYHLTFLYHLLTNNILLRDNTRISAVEGTSIKVWGFIPVKLRVKDKCGKVRVTNECLYFAEGVLTTLVS